MIQTTSKQRSKKNASLLTKTKKEAVITTHNDWKFPMVMLAEMNKQGRGYQCHLEGSFECDYGHCDEKIHENMLEQIQH